MESKEWVWDNGVLKSKTVEAYKRAKSVALAEAKAEVFKDFLKKL